MPLWGCDQSQLELRVATAVWRDARWVEDLLSGDMHQATVDRLVQAGYLQNLGPVVRRTRAKNVNFGVLYMSGGTDIAAESGASVEEMVDLVERHRETYPEFHAAQARDVRALQRDGQIQTITGMPHVVPMTGNKRIDNEAIRSTMNALVQGPAAQITRLAGVMFRNWLVQELRPKHGFRTRVINNVHDAIYGDSPEEELAEIVPGVQRLMESVPTKEAWRFELVVPLKAPVKVADSWGWLDVEEKDIEKYCRKYNLTEPRRYLV